ncbi:flagellar protein FliO/FliZ [Paenibacillus forsythiae]|uniref:Flagellar protein FliO/FliZ n=1 Tax=Paenibacillus forsythiae TaxID=365616 RepID=A0ABU3H142_9BACL|nr:flagellar biosynthetic protein FliO [Paenibacillus forsythiae]MDT3424527.1 flagellar protein FliO/FliZ [Paenibacillus forsythiae]
MSGNTELLSTDNNLLNLLKVIFVLAVIIVIIILLIRFMGSRNHAWMKGRSMRTLGAVGLGPNKSMQVIEIGGSLYLIGVGENVTILDKITDPEEVALIVSAFEEQSVPGGNFFIPLITKVRERLRGEVPSQEIDLNETSSFYEMLQSRLRSAPNRETKMEELPGSEDQKGRQGDI